MFQFATKQTTFEIGNVQLGGQPGATPTVLIGSIFYRGQKLVKDPKMGRFDKIRARQHIENQDEMAAKTGNPCMVDVIGDTPDALTRYIDFIAEATEAPFLLDSTSASTRIAALRYAAEIGLLDRAVYNSLMPHPRSEELEAIRDAKLQQVVLLAFDKQLTTSTGRVHVIKNDEGTGLLDLVVKYGVAKALIDTTIIDIPSLGLACRAINVLKENYGLVCGCGAHNAVETWKGLKSKFQSRLRKTAVTTSAVIPVTAGADFVLYGPLEHAKTVFPMVAMVDAAWGQLVFEQTGKIDHKHPLFKIA